MAVPGTDHRIYSIAKHIGMVVTGLIPDGRALVERAREECNSFYKQFGVPISGKVLAERIAATMHFNTIHMMSRPYGCTLIIAAYDQTNGPSLHMIDSAGQCFGYFGCAAGKGRQMARNEIEKMNPKNLTCKDTIFNIAKLYFIRIWNSIFRLCKAHEEMKEKKFELEISMISPESKMNHQILPKETVVF